MKNTKETTVVAANAATTKKKAVKGKKKADTNKQSAQEIINSIEEGNADLKELPEKQRNTLIEQFNEKNNGVAKLLTEKADDDYVAECKKAFEEYQNAYFDHDYEIADGKTALEYAEWLKDWNYNYAVAPANYWVGILKFDEVIKEHIEKLKKAKDDDKKLVFDYGAVTYTYNLMMSPSGTGYKYAQWMLDNQTTYNGILNKLAEFNETISLIKKKIGMLQSRWALACQGFKMDILIKDLKDYKTVDLTSM